MLLLLTSLLLLASTAPLLPSSQSLTNVLIPNGYGTPTPSPSNDSAMAHPSPEREHCVIMDPCMLCVHKRSASSSPPPTSFGEKSKMAN